MPPRVATEQPVAPAQRLVSLDVFRGITMAAMVIVNNPGDWSNVYWPLLHAPWHGWTPTDLIFPFFLFIVGVSITLSRKTAGWSSILRRAAIIFALGLFLAGYPRFDLDRWRIPGVLQRIGICYLVAAAAWKIAAGNERRRPLMLGALALALAVAYHAIMMYVPPPGGTAGNLTPEGNLGAFIDRALMAGHLWRPGWDPEGLLSTLPAIATTLLGVVAGIWIAGAASPQTKVRGLAIAGVAAVTAGYLWHPFFPINKNLWTSSYVLFTAGAAAWLLAFCYRAIDVKGWRGWTRPFVVLGVNAITLFVASALLVKTLALIRVGADGATMSASRYAYQYFFVPLATSKIASLLYSLANLVVLYGLLAWMYRRRIFLRV